MVSPRGSVLGPVLFLVFINDFPDVIEVLLTLFADDAKVYNIIAGLNDAQPLQRRVNIAGTWSIERYLQVLGHPFEKVANEKDLGVIIDSKLTFLETT